MKDRGAWHAAVHWVTKSQTWFSNWTTATNCEWKVCWGIFLEETSRRLRGRQECGESTGWSWGELLKAVSVERELWAISSWCSQCLRVWVSQPWTENLGAVPQHEFFLVITKLYFLIELQLICNIVWASSIQQSDSIMHEHIYIFIYIFFFRFLYIRSYYKILNRAPCTMQCTIQWFIYFIYSVCIC